MKIVRNNIIPFKGYKAVNLFGILFVRDDAVIGSVDINHESIHTAQMKEMLYVFSTGTHARHTGTSDLSVRRT